MTQAIAQNPHALAILAALTTAGVAAGDGHAPHSIDPGSDAWTPYSVLYMLNGGELDGPLNAPEADGELPFQLTSVGRLAAEARYQADEATAAITTTAITVTGRTIQRARLSEAGSGVQRDDDVQPPLFYVVQRFVLTSRPG